MLTPAIDTVHVTIVDGDRHLATAVRLNAIELLLVTDTLIAEGLLGPGTELYSAVAAYHCIMLLLQELPIRFLDHGLGRVERFFKGCGRNV